MSKMGNVGGRKDSNLLCFFPSECIHTVSLHHCTRKSPALRVKVKVKVKVRVSGTCGEGEVSILVVLFAFCMK